MRKEGDQTNNNSCPNVKQTTSTDLITISAAPSALRAMGFTAAEKTYRAIDGRAYGGDGQWARCFHATPPQQLSDLIATPYKNSTGCTPIAA